MRRLTLLAMLMCLASCDGHGTPFADEAAARQARDLIAQRCGACHRVPGIDSAQGRVGPSLAEISRQQVIAGHFVNTPEMLTRWIEHPQSLLPGDAMPEMGLSHEQARLIADYLYRVE
ncbi:MAG TPA: c-type cytochrome [Steroidobacteraceae bacterium]|jgi:cytochrome c1